MSTSKLNKIEETKNYYNERAEDWARVKTNSFYHEKEFSKFASLLPEKSEILDIGCANGSLVPLFFGIGRHLEYHGIDISESFLNIARRRYPQLCFELGNIADIASLPNKTFDGFLATAVLMHVPLEQWNQMFSNIEKMMRSGAVGYLSFPSQHPSGDKENEDPRQFTILNPTQQKQYIADRGWQIIHSGIQDGYSVKSIWNWYIVKLP